MSMDDQAITAVISPLDLAASLIAGKPPKEDKPEEVIEEAIEDAIEEAEEEADEGEAEGDEEASDEPAPVKTYAVTVKNEDGSEAVEQVTQEDLVKGYMRQADYTRKTTGLAEREREAVQVMSSQVDKARETYLTQLHEMQSVVSATMGLRSPQEMAAMASADPAEWVRESQRQQLISQVLGGIQQQTQHEHSQREQQAEQERARQRSDAWGHLGQKGFDRQKLDALYRDVEKLPYGLKYADLTPLLDHRMVFALSDLVEYHKLKASKPALAARVAKAPPVPQTKQHQPQQEKMRADARARVNKPGAGLRDLAAFIQAHR